MLELTEKTIEHVKALYYVALIVCVAGAIVLFFYSPQGDWIDSIGGISLVLGTCEYKHCVV